VTRSFFRRSFGPRCLRAALVSASAASAAVGCSALLDAGSLSNGAADTDGQANDRSNGTRGDELDAAEDQLAFTPPDARPLDPVGVGNGKDGPLDVTGSNVVNRYAAVAADIVPGAIEIPVDNAGLYASGDLIMVWQTSGVGGRPGGPSLNLTQPSSPVGRFEFVRVASSTGGTVRVATPLAYAYAKAGAQVVFTREYTDVTVRANGTLTAPPWNGKTGGAVVVFASGTVRVEGSISVNGLGFRGGTGFVIANTQNCVNDDGTPSTGYASKGEGVAPQGYSSGADPAAAIGGKANVTNGGGGGNCHNTGGGGGGNGSPGGNGGRDYYNAADLGGRGGGSLVYSLLDRLTLGGGGGAPDQNNAATAINGAPGGGAIYLRARALEITGTIQAQGASALNVADDGAGGGGAGGSISLRIVEGATCNNPVAAGGGNGGNTRLNVITSGVHGPGGGGGGGRVLLQAARSSCVIEVPSGAPGKPDRDGGAAYGATYGAGPATPNTGFVEPPPPGGFTP
jgi:hypothetical protein